MEAQNNKIFMINILGTNGYRYLKIDNPSQRRGLGLWRTVFSWEESQEPLRNSHRGLVLYSSARKRRGLSHGKVFVITHWVIAVPYPFKIDLRFVVRELQLSGVFL